MHFYKKKQTNPLFEDKNHKITFKRQDFNSATYSGI